MTEICEASWSHFWSSDMVTAVFTPAKRREIKSTVPEFLKTFRRMPDEVVLDLCTRNLQMNQETSCVCGWALRAEIGRATNCDAARVRLGRHSGEVPEECARRFGGTVREWENIFLGVIDSKVLPRIERALIRRLAAIVGDITPNAVAVDNLLAEVTAEPTSCEMSVV